MDAVYILGTGSLANNEEIKYSIRSLSKHMLDLRNIYVVGEKPEDLPGVIHIPAEDSFELPWQNVLQKTRVACAHPDISEEFLFMNDDFFMLEKFTGADFPFYSLKGADGGPSGRLCFQVHCPIRFNKKWYAQMPLSPEMKGKFSPRSFYCNFYRAPEKPTIDFALLCGEDALDFPSQVVGRDWFTISNSTMLDSDFRCWLYELYPTPSRFE